MFLVLCIWVNYNFGKGSEFCDFRQGSNIAIQVIYIDLMFKNEDIPQVNRMK